MTTPDRPLRFELTVEVPGTPEQVWDAIATARGISAWMMPTDMDERAGGAVVFHMGPEEKSEGTVTGFEPPRRLVYEEDWATLVGQDPATVTPLVTEFLVEAASGGTCVVKVVSSAFGSGADWENEFFADMAKGWTPVFDHLRLYLAHFPGKAATFLEAIADVPGTPEAVMAAVRQDLGAGRAGDTVAARGLRGDVERVADTNVLVRLADPLPGYLAVFAFGAGDKTSARLGGYLFAADAPAYVEREQAGWQAWLEGVAAGAGRR